MSAPAWLETTMHAETIRGESYCVSCFAVGEHKPRCQWAKIKALVEQMGETLRIAEQHHPLCDIDAALAAYERGPEVKA